MHELVDTTPAVSSTSNVKPPQRLFIPGPTDVLPEVLEAQTAPMIGHRSDEFEALFAKCEGQLQRLFETRKPCLHRRRIRLRPAGGRHPQLRRRPRGLLCQRRVQPALARYGGGLRQAGDACRRGVEHCRQAP